MGIEDADDRDRKNGSVEVTKGFVKRKKKSYNIWIIWNSYVTPLIL